MMCIVARLIFIGVLGATTSFAQQPAFEAASVKVVKIAAHPAFGNSSGPGTSDPGRIHLCCVGMFSLLMRAYDVELDQIVGPSWIMENMGPNLYQVDATMPADTTKAQYQLMMQDLLKQRFHLEIHREKRTFPGYDLVVAEGGPKLKESKPNPNTVIPNSSEGQKRGADGTLVLPPGPQMSTSLGRGVIIVQAQEKSIGDLVKGMGRLIAQALGEAPSDFASPKPRVLDKTGLTGKYDFTLKFSCDACQFGAANGGFGDAPPSDPLMASSIFVAVQKQLGLKLVKTKEIPLDVIIVDRVDKTPTAN